MESIVILGDVRYHNLTNAPGSAKAPTYNGGVFLVDTAIKNALECSSIENPPAVLTLEPPKHEPIAFNRRTPSNQTDGVMNWEVVSKPSVTSSHKRYVLTNRKPIGDCVLPICDETLIEKIDTWEKTANECPHIVVIDDLGIQFREECRFDITKHAEKTKENLLNDLSSHRANLKTLTEASQSNYETDEGKKNLLATQINTNNEARNFTKTIMAKLLSGMLSKSKAISQSGENSPAEPVTIVSLAGRIPRIQPIHLSEKKIDKTYLDYLHSDKALRRRTIVIMEVESLQEVISISRGLSWERTALDTVVEMRRNPIIQDYLRFGFVIVRFGVSGLVLLKNDQNGKVSYRLYFHPEEDDRISSPADDEMVLGSNAVLIATIVEQLNKNCQWRKGRSILQDLSKSIDRSLRLAVNRMVNHMELGYGRNDAEFFASRGNLNRKIFRSQSDYILQDLKLDLNHDRSDERSISIVEGDSSISTVATQSVDISGYRFRHWSILSNSTQASLNDVAREIVLHGPTIALNAYEDPVVPFIDAWVKISEEAISELLYVQDGWDKVESTDFANVLHEQLKLLTETNDTALAKSIGMQLFETASKIHSALERDNAVKKRKPKGNFGSAVKTLLSVQKKNWRMLNSQIPEDILTMTTNLGDLFQDLFDYVDIVDAKGINETIEFIKSEIESILKDNPDEIKHGNLADFADKWFSEIDEKRLRDPFHLLRQELSWLFDKFEPSGGWIPAISAPVLRIGKRATSKGEPDQRMLVIDRKEIESIRAIKRTIEQYLVRSRSNSNKRPLSIGVFGPPGAGKSVAVKKIIEELRIDHKLTEMKTINLSTLSDVRELYERIQSIASESLNAKDIPIIFFDEFDSALQGDKLGWLKYFLSIMEDGNHVIEAVFIFAGGTASSFESFSLKDRSTSDNLWIEFSEKKGPDFVSRLMGHINVVGINANDTDDEIFLIRRALMLRFMLEQEQKLKSFEKASIDEKMLNALLHVPVYHHGARSMRILVDLCRHKIKNRISMSEVPPIHQLDMQVDGKTFAALASGQIEPLLSRSDLGLITPRLDVFTRSIIVWAEHVKKKYSSKKPLEPSKSEDGSPPPPSAEGDPM